MPEPIQNENGTEETKVEETTTESSTEGVTPEEGDKVLTAEDWQVQLSERDKQIDDLKTDIEESNSRTEALQDSLNSALDEINLQGEKPTVDPVASVDAGETNPPPVEGEKKADATLEKEIESTLREDDAFRKEQSAQLEEILQSNSERALREEVDSACTKFPEANRGEILLAIEDGSEDSVESLAQKSSERINLNSDKMKKTIEDNVKEQFSKESEGSTSVPQSSGNSSSPENATEKKVELSPDDQWGEALAASKAESKGE